MLEVKTWAFTSEDALLQRMISVVRRLHGPHSLRHTGKDMKIRTLPTLLILIGYHRTWRSDICVLMSSHSRSIFGQIILSDRAAVCYELFWF